MPKEPAGDEPLASPVSDFKARLQNITEDTVKTVFKEYFFCKKLTMEPFVSEGNVHPNSTFRQTCKCFLRTGIRARVGTVHVDLLSLASQWERLRPNSSSPLTITVGSTPLFCAWLQRVESFVSYVFRCSLPAM